VTLVADADIPEPVIRSLQIVKYDIVRYSEIGLPSRPDRALMEALLQSGDMLLTRDTGIPLKHIYTSMGFTG
jgi:hypothetical protein